MKQMALLAAINERDSILRALAENHSVYLAALRAYAREHALRYGEVCIDDVRDAITRDGYPMPEEIGADERVFARAQVTVYRLKESKAA